MRLVDLKKHNHEYLGYCTQMGYIYSVQRNVDEYSVVAVQGNDITILITYTVGGK